ncbi:Perforin-1 [Platysternon megacephalum]|uniref:Perforin-1 n=1 Tax=Platysternon megacephalum TaxID=55544 RepID=A0A4D9EB78_9SAUR|nr:Perforin-1 [Platysternon megacephalum]
MLGWMGAYLVDTSLWCSPNGTCSLCQNPLQGEQWQRLPLVVVDWRVHSWCNQDLSSSVEESNMAVIQAMASDMKNDWKLELELLGESHGLAHPGYAHLKEQQDKYMFVHHKVSCVYYSLDMYRLCLAPYGPHYLSQVTQGGLMAIESKECLVSQFSLDLGPKCCERSSSWYRWCSQAASMEHHTEITGGHTKLLFSTKQDTRVFSAWMESLKPSWPGLLLPSAHHTLVGPEDPRREALRWVVKEYMAEWGRRRSCPHGCPERGYSIYWDLCKCKCYGNPLTNSMCCPHRQGMAQLKIHMLWGSGL